MSDHEHDRTESNGQDDTDLEVDRETGAATIVYDHPEEGTVEETVANEQIVYVQDHWAFTSGTDDDGNDLVRRVPHTRVHYVERSVEEFEEEIKSIRRRVESIADEVRQKLPVSLGQGEGRGRTRGGGSDEVHRTSPQSIAVEDAPDDDETDGDTSTDR
ncbi:hypothetical protein C2R22_16625 [Salinigranum rubrum]|uniref:Uncharacterized protein n=1 Tax=Salinigranum rubrum TaxID=755307 RepID=A0A2I8VPM7_9EURY|nr:hypothetical protein [Salinigranum rubrum]AUV83069.1 hypothetical protein C2R22_16625 [Salinigranum rubrum]